MTWLCEACGKPTPQGPFVDGDGIGHLANCGGMFCSDRDDRLVERQRIARARHDRATSGAAALGERISR